MLSAEKLREILHYTPETGVFVWRVPSGRWGRIHPGTVAGSTNKIHGYNTIHYEGRMYPAHRLAWLYMTGEWPKAEIDHINRNRGDNRFSNLRAVTTAQNLLNKNRYTSNTSGQAGVNWHKRIGLWQARISLGGKRHHLGYWADKAQAAAAYAEAKGHMHTI